MTNLFVSYLKNINLLSSSYQTLTISNDVCYVNLLFDQNQTLVIFSFFRFEKKKKKEIIYVILIKE